MAGLLGHLMQHAQQRAVRGFVQHLAVRGFVQHLVGVKRDHDTTLWSSQQPFVQPSSAANGPDESGSWSTVPDTPIWARLDYHDDSAILPTTGQFTRQRTP